MQAPIFSISGLRGVVGESLFPDTVRDYARSFGRLVGPGVVAVGRDSRPSGAVLVEAAIAGLQGAGCEVVDLGVCPTPTAVHFVRQGGGSVRGGLVITASHNPWEWNGMKFVHSQGRFLLPEEVTVLGALLRPEEKGGAGASAAGLRPGGVRRMDAVGGHIAGITGSEIFAGVRMSGKKFAVDAVNGAAAAAGCELLRAFGCEVVPVFCTMAEAERGFPRGPEPVPEHLARLCAVVKEQGLDGGFAFDPDGDRLSCVDENGVSLGEEATLALAAQFVLARRQGAVVVNLSTSRLIEDICARFGCPVVRTRVGEVWVVREIINRGAVFGGEGNGGVIVPEVNLTRDGLVAIAGVLGLMCTTGRSLARLREELPGYFIVKRALPGRGALAIDAVRERLPADLLAGATVDTTEGLRLAGADWWLHIRPSNTEPIVRVVAEAATRERAVALVELASTALAPEGVAKAERKG